MVVDTFRAGILSDRCLQWAVATGPLDPKLKSLLMNWPNPRADIAKVNGKRNFGLKAATAKFVI